MLQTAIDQIVLEFLFAYKVNAWKISFSLFDSLLRGCFLDLKKSLKSKKLATVKCTSPPCNIRPCTVTTFHRQKRKIICNSCQVYFEQRKCQMLPFEMHQVSLGRGQCVARCIDNYMTYMLTNSLAPLEAVMNVKSAVKSVQNTKYAFPLSLSLFPFCQEYPT